MPIANTPAMRGWNRKHNAGCMACADQVSGRRARRGPALQLQRNQRRNDKRHNGHELDENIH